jgi:hypothetical protein
MFNREERRKNKAYREKLKGFKKILQKTIIDANWSVDDTVRNWNIMNLESTAIMMDEAITLSRLTRWLVILSVILSALTGVLAYSVLRSIIH